MRRRELSPVAFEGRHPKVSPNTAPRTPSVPQRRRHQWTGYLLHSVHKQVEREYKDRIGELGLLPHQVGILQLLSAEGQMPQARLGKKLGVDKAAMVQNLNGLESVGAVERKAHPDDRRAFMVEIRPHGLELLKRAELVNAAVSEKVFALLSIGERETLHDLLLKMQPAL